MKRWIQFELYTEPNIIRHKWYEDVSVSLTSSEATIVNEDGLKYTMAIHNLMANVRWSKEEPSDVADQKAVADLVIKAMQPTKDSWMTGKELLEWWLPQRVGSIPVYVLAKDGEEVVRAFDKFDHKPSVYHKDDKGLIGWTTVNSDTFLTHYQDRFRLIPTRTKEQIGEFND